MALFGSEAILEWSLEGRNRKNAATLIKNICRVAAQGNGSVPLDPFLQILEFSSRDIKKFTSQRGRIDIQCPKGPQGKLEGTFLNRGQPMQNTIPRMEMMDATMKIQRVVKGRFFAKDDLLRLTEIQGMAIQKALLQQKNGESMGMSFQVERLLLKPTSLAIF
ncbi:hypothetical protein NITGR_250080 [Nitrospina gracilis 3/211]|uniref:Uncharacterized protein n=1 Tax=Nitrospina gracilis (strain 3/211) TaxID=1266370 RepID=M1YWY6_NITG3|nr:MULTISPECIES: hypothetical protein [Nitrospina]MCF8723125.1 hypothetical protein [Nitrospina sp. Nb-3]CCQ90167.1 hypothetical protein NITGR_250080 [Nitrospina gracilis 3/211]